MIRRLGGCIAVAAALALGSAPASAHVAIRLDVRSPTAGQHVGRRPTVVVFAQPMLAGAPGAPFTLEVDGDLAGTGTYEIAAGATKSVQLPRLPSGQHQLRIRYRADGDEPPTSVTVPFTVSTRHRSRPWLPITIGATLLLVVAAIARVSQRHTPVASRVER